ncbi:MAG: NAD(P)H-dependent oxidoreductase [Pseudomonadota bacterium]
MSGTILRIDASPRGDNSITRALTDRLINRLQADGAGKVIQRDLTTPLPYVDELWIGASFTEEAKRNPAQEAALALSDALIEELKRADTIILGVPIYNFGVPAVLKAWIDQVARAGVTFTFSEAGPEGLLKGKRAFVTVASGGTEVGSPIDYTTGYLRHFLGFIGISDVTLIAADQTAIDAEGSVKKAEAAIDALDL